MKKRNLFIIIFIVSVLGLLIIQYQYLTIGLNLANVQFNQNMGKTVKSIQLDLSSKNQLTFLVGKAITNDDTYFKAKLDSVREASSYFLKDFLESKLLENGIKTDFSYKLFVKDTLLYIKSANFVDQKEKLKKYPIQLNGYLPALLHKNIILELQFNKINDYFLKQLSGLTVPSLIFLTAIILVVIWVLRSFYWQQQIITRTNDFINNLAHELKTPVFSIGLATKMLQQKQKEEDKTYLEIIKNQNDRLKEHIETVLQLANLESNQQNLTLIKTDFYPYLNKLCNEFKQLVLIESVTFNFDIKAKQLVLKCDPMYLSNAINNLLDNAKKYRKETPEIHLLAEIKNKNLRICVSDNGIGIEKKDQKNIFKKHFRVTFGNLHSVKGYGLGLYYVKKIITLHKGTIHLESEINQGTKMIVNIPIVI